MTDTHPGATSDGSALIQASREQVFRAFIDPHALAAWQAPGDMTATVHGMNARVGGGYRMSLFYPETDQGSPGKTADREDRFTARFVELIPSSRIVEAITFETDDPAFAGEMTMTVSLEDRDGGTLVTIAYVNLPLGVRPEDNDMGTRESLKKLAAYVTDGKAN